MLKNSMKKFIFILERDLYSAYKNNSNIFLVIIFFILIICLFPFSVGPDLNNLATLAPAVIWIAALLTSMLSLEKLFEKDYEDGTIELLLLSSIPFELIVFMKTIVHWLTSGLPIILTTPLVIIFFNLKINIFYIILLTMIIGTPILSFIGTIGAALTLGIKQRGVLLALITLPLYIPTLIFGINTINNINQYYTYISPQLLVLLALFLIALILCPIISTIALRKALESN